MHFAKKFKIEFISTFSRIIRIVKINLYFSNKWKCDKVKIHVIFILRLQWLQGMEIVSLLSPCSGLVFSSSQLNSSSLC